MKNKIQATAAFKSLSAIQKSIYSKSANIREITSQYVIAKNTNQSKCENGIIRKIVDELLNNQ